MSAETSVNNNEETTEEVIDNTTESAETENTDTDVVDVEGNKVPYDRFKTKVDEVNALKAKLEAIETEAAEAERKALEEQNDYKTLYEQSQATLESQKADVLEAKKDALLAQAGYSDEQAERYKRYIDGQSDEELAQALKQLIADIPPKKNYIDPSPMGGGDSKPKPSDGEELGKKMYDRIKHKLRG